MEYAHIKDNKVINVIVWDEESELSYSNELVLLTNNAGIDWDYIDGEFIDNRPKINFEGI
jgi:uncharacterized membrane protein